MTPGLGGGPECVEMHVPQNHRRQLEAQGGTGRREAQ